MPRRFNTAGPCDPAKHYMLPPERRLPGVRDLIDQEHYFVIHAPRQVGKTTSFHALARNLTAEGRYAALLTSCEAGQLLAPDLEKSLSAVLETLRQDAEEYLPAEIRPPAADPSLAGTIRFRDLLVRWSRQCPRPVVLFLDEIDALTDEALVSLLRQLRSGYRARPRGFPQALALIGLRDVRDYAFNIKVESLTLRNFNADEVAELYSQHTADTSQVFTPEAEALAFELTGGHPWLVNALAREAVEKRVPDPTLPVTAEIITIAKEALIARRDTHLDSLIDRLREPRVQRVIEPILAGELLHPDVLDDDIQLAQDLGLVVSGPQGLKIANPIYREVIPRALTSVLQQSLPTPRISYKDAEGRLRFNQLLEDFRAFWCQNAEAFLARAPYAEAAAQLVFMAFLHKVVNGGGFIDREFAVGSGRVDLCVRWPWAEGVEHWPVELKVWRDGRPDPLAEGLEQLSGYLTRLGLGGGTLILFDSRSSADSLPGRCSLEEMVHKGWKVAVLRL